MPRYVLLYDQPKNYEQFMLVLNVKDELLANIEKEFPIHAYLDLLTTPDPMPRSPEVIKFYSTNKPRSTYRVVPTHVLLSRTSEHSQAEIDNTYGPILKVERGLTEGVIDRRELLLSNSSYLYAMHDMLTVEMNYTWFNNSLYHGLRQAFYKIDPGIDPAKY